MDGSEPIVVFQGDAGTSRMSTLRAVKAIESRLEKISGPGSSKKVNDEVVEFERLLLDDAYPDECLQLMIDVVSRPEFTSIKGIQGFVRSLFTDMPRLSDKQAARFLDAVRASLPTLQQVELCWALGDLVARCYPKQVAFRLLTDVAAVAQSSAMEGVMLGLDVLRMHNKEDRAITDTMARIARQDKSR